ncbi:MAG: tetratricopeptide repeat protein [Candidatus Magnetomorum sp.]|nr:tetratricopeptide repeat protein [Candidatus Magnetomorum sp.]
MSTGNEKKILSEMMGQAFIYQQKDQHESAIHILSEMIEIEPNNSDAHHYLGVSYLHQKKFQKAVFEMEYAVQLSPELDYYYSNLGMAYWKNGQREKAINCFKQGLKLKADHQYIQINLSQVLMDAGRLEESLIECYKFLEKYPDNYTVFFLLILIEHRLCKKDIITSTVKSHVRKKNISLEKWLASISEGDDIFLFTKGVLYILFEKYEQGIHFIKKSESIVPGSGWIFTYKTIFQINHHYGSIANSNICKKPQVLHHSDYQGVISMNDLGIRGRLGHQIQYYLGLKKYARKHNYCLEVSDWLGRYLFEGCDDPFVSDIYDTIDSTDPAFIRSTEDNCSPPKKKFNLRGSCFHMPTTSEEKQHIQQLLKLRPFWRKKLEPCITRLKKHHKTLLTIHVRRGDFIKDGRYVPSNQVYLKWLEKIWPDLDQPVLYLSSDEAEKIQADYWKFNPFIGRDFGKIFCFDDFLTDFYVLSHSDIVVVAQSSFSRIAAMCNEKCSQFYRVNPETQKIETVNH